MKYKLSNNTYFGWHRGTRGIRAYVQNSAGETVAELCGVQSSAYSGGGAEYIITKITDEQLVPYSRRKDGRLRTFNGRKELLEFINDPTLLEYVRGLEVR